jgi:hypothetical protein
VESIIGVKIRIVKEGWEIDDYFQGRFCRKVFPSPTSIANGAVECEIRERGRQAMICIIVQYWCRILLTKQV